MSTPYRRPSPTPVGGDWDRIQPDYVLPADLSAAHVEIQRLAMRLRQVNHELRVAEREAEQDRARLAQVEREAEETADDLRWQARTADVRAREDRYDMYGLTGAPERRTTR